MASFGLMLLALCGGLVVGVLAALLLARLSSQRAARALAETETRLKASVQELASAALSQNTDMFMKLARETFGRQQDNMQGALREREQALQALVEPIKSALQKTEAQVESLERERREAFVTLRSQIETLALGHTNLQRETHNLVTALRRPEVRGRWGELTLRRVVELAGLSEHCDFAEQSSVGEAGGLLRPDLVVYLPERRRLVVDAKTPLDAYLDAIDASTEELRTEALARHAKQVEARVRELASKAYWEQFEHSPEFAVLFLPGDQFLSTALAHRPELLEHALRTGVIVATPSTLIALLKTVAYGWRQAAVAENAERIRDLGQELHKRLSTFVNHLARAGRSLGGAVDAYNAAVGSLERQVLPGARKFTELGAATGEPIANVDQIEHLVRDPAGDGNTLPNA
ncbi:MAG: DNA recombination protein RmuC [Steroidobacteraceae bacterium]